MPATITGLGLFSGTPATLTIDAAPKGSGLWLRHARSSEPPTPPTINFLSTLPQHTCFPPQISGRNTTVAHNAAAATGFATIEHLMSALAGLHIADAIITLDGPEIPILDGSALPFVNALRAIVPSAPRDDRPPLILDRPIEVVDPRGSRIRSLPRSTPGTFYSYTLDYGAKSPFPAQAAEFDSARDDYARDVAPARTFSLMHEAQALQKMGLFTHLTPRDMLVLDERGQPIDNQLRFENEPARHKLLDLIGDVALLGRPIQADIYAERSGHSLTHELVREILRQSI
jgi:UDP-3-O-acyl-N-acetylglucosamine deacetylase